MRVQVGVALSSRPWRGALQRHCRDHVADVVINLLHDGREGLADGADVVLVDDDTSWLSIPFVTQAREAGVTVIGLYDPLEGDGHGQRQLQRAGVGCIIPATFGIEELIDLIRSSKPDHDARRRFDELTTDLSRRRPMGTRRVIAVGGPAGAGATEASIAVAQSSAEQSGRTLLLDVDESHPTLARRLGLGLHPHLLSAIDASRGQQNGPRNASAELTDCLARPAVGTKKLPFDVMVGLVSRDDWPLARADDVEELIVEVSANWSEVIVHLGPQLEDLSRHVDRFEVSRRAASKANRVLAVCDGSATGVLRFVDWLVDLLMLVGDAPIDVVINRAPRENAVRDQLVAQLREIAGDRVGRIESVGYDRRVERASWDASLIVGGKFLKSVRSVLGETGSHRVERTVITS